MKIFADVCGPPSIDPIAWAVAIELNATDLFVFESGTWDSGDRSAAQRLVRAGLLGVPGTRGDDGWLMFYRTDLARRMGHAMRHGSGFRRTKLWQQIHSLVFFIDHARLAKTVIVDGNGEVMLDFREDISQTSGRREIDATGEDPVIAMKRIECLNRCTDGGPMPKIGECSALDGLHYGRNYRAWWSSARWSQESGAPQGDGGVVQCTEPPATCTSVVSQELIP